MEKRALGKGLSALIPERAPETHSKESVMQVPTAKVMTNRYQPRLDFKEDKLNELVSSIKEKGVIQPILVRKHPAGFELIAGERRLRAAKKLGLENIPAILKDVSDLDMLEISLIENIQREELNPIEEARAFQKFITDFAFTQEKIAQVLGKDRSTVANTIRLLSLSKKIQDYISKGEITAGHAKAILSLPTENEQLRVTNLIIKKGLSVRETEELVSKRKHGASIAKESGKKNPQLTDIEADLQRLFGTRVTIFHGTKRGRIQIEYYSNDDLNRILDILSKRA